jgi:hypothetical protein
VTGTTSLLLSACALLAAPFLEPILRHRRAAESFTNGAVQVFVGGLLLVHVLPFGLSTAGWGAAVALLVGIGLGLGAHRVPGGERWAGIVAVFALLLHCVVDGAALAIPDGDEGPGVFGWAVVLHSLPVGLAVWRVSSRRAGRGFAAGLLVASLVATAAGWFGAEQVLQGASSAALGVAQCLVAGALLHVLGHLDDGAPVARAAGWGALAGMVGVVALAIGHPVPRAYAEELDGGLTVYTLVAEAAPALLVGYAAAGVLHAFAPEALPRWLTGRSVLASAGRGALLGLPVPVCSCGSLPVYRSLLARGVPAAAALAFLVAAPEIGVGTLAVSVPLLGTRITLLRLAAGLAVALAAGVLVSPHIVPSRPRTPPPAVSPPLGQRIREGLHFAFVDTVAHTAPWVIAGLLLAGLIEPLLPTDSLRHLSGGLGVVAAALAGVPAYVCASGATPLAAVLVHKGLSAGAAIAFLLTGPATNLSTVGLLRRLHGRHVALTFSAVVTGLSVAIGIAIDAGWPDLDVPALHAASAHEHGLVELASAGILGALFAAALVRQGAVGFLEPLLNPHHDHALQPERGHHAHDHAHHSHTHSHQADESTDTAAASVRGAGRRLDRKSLRFMPVKTAPLAPLPPPPAGSDEPDPGKPQAEP